MSPLYWCSYRLGHPPTRAGEQPSFSHSSATLSMLRPAVTCPRRRLTRSLVAHCAERTIALLAFEDVKAAPMADLLDIAQRQKTASELNAAILASQDLVRPSFRNWAGLPAAQLGAQTMHVHARAAQCCGCCSRQLCGAQHDVHRRTVVGVVSSMSSISRTAYWVALQEPEPRLPGLLKMLLWAQQRLEERVEFPKCGQPLCNLSIRSVTSDTSRTR